MREEDLYAKQQSFQTQQRAKNKRLEGFQAFI